MPNPAPLLLGPAPHDPVRLHPAGVYLPMSARELPTAPRVTENSSRPGTSLMTELPRQERCGQCPGKQRSSAQKKRAELIRPEPSRVSCTLGVL